jgi:hypothetical protein
MPKPRGIVSPFVEEDTTPKTDPSSLPIHQKNSKEAEAPLPTFPRKSSIELDGDSYIVRIWDAKTLDDVALRLGRLFYAVKEEFEEELETLGIYFTTRDQTWTIHTPSGEFFVSVPGEGTNMDVYRRLGYALSRLRVPIKDILKKMGVQVLERG